MKCNRVKSKILFSGRFPDHESVWLHIWITIIGVSVLSGFPDKKSRTHVSSMKGPFLR